MSNWKCVECGYVHRKNVSKCSSCSNTILQQTKEAPDSTLGRLLQKLGL